jgi:hypothetical protein
MDGSAGESDVTRTDLILTIATALQKRELSIKSQFPQRQRLERATAVGMASDVVEAIPEIAYMTTEDVIADHDKQWIDTASLEQLLRRWRFAAIGDELFQGVTGKYFADRMFTLRNASPDLWVAASKSVGW